MLFFSFSLLWFYGCKSIEKVTEEKSGAQLWGETCSRCHNYPSPIIYTDDKWETVSMHMKVRANISNPDIKLIKEFLQSSNED